jgi:hypothetical protein
VVLSAPPSTRRRRALGGLALVVAALAAATGLGSSPAGAGAPPYCEETTTTRFVCGSYYSFARRTPSEVEMDYWVAQMPAKKTVFLSTLGKSVESRRRMIEQYYYRYADVEEVGDDELAYWQGEVLKPNGFRRLEAALFLAFEGTPSDLVDWAFSTVLDREALPAEATYWEAKAEADGHGAMAAALIGTPEVRDLRVRWAYQNELSYFPDEDSGDYWAERLRTGTSFLELRIALKTAGYPDSSGFCSAPFPATGYWCT